MIITRIQMKNFRSIADADINTSQVAVFFGMNGAGKSSVLMAVQMALLGYCEHTSTNGAGAACLLRDGAKKSVTVITMQHDGDTYKLTYTLTRSGKSAKQEYEAANIDTGETWETRNNFWKHMQIDPRHVAICTMPDKLLTSKEIGDTLADYLAGDLDPEELRSITHGHDDWLTEFARDEQNPLATVADYQQIGKAAFSTRTNVKKELAQAKTDAEALQAVGLPRTEQGKQLTVDDLDTFETVTTKLETKIKVLYAERGNAEAQPDQEAVQAQWIALNEQMSQHSKAASFAHEDEVRAEGDLSVAEAELKALQTQETTHREEARQADRRRDAAKAACDALISPDGSCPTCKREYTDTLRKTLLGPLEAQIAEAVSISATCSDAADAVHKQITTQHEVVKEATEALQHEHALYIKYDRDAMAVQAKIDALPKPTETRAVQEIQADIDAAEAKVERGHKLIEQLRQVKARENAEACVANYEVMLEHLNWAVEQFKDGAAIKRLVKGKLPEFTARVNAELDLFGYALSVDVQGKSVEIVLQTPGSGERPARLCSQGDQVLAQFAVAMAFADTGSPVMLDDINHLDQRNRKALLGRLRTHTDGSVLMAGAWQQSDTDMVAITSALAPVTVVWVQGGAVNYQERNNG